MKKKVFIALTAVMVTLAAAAQTTDVGGNDRIAQLEKEMYRYYSSSAIDSFMLITDQLIEACREAGPSQERLFYKAWSNQAIYCFSKVNRTHGLELAHQIHDYAYQHDSKFGLYTSTYALASMSSSLRHFAQAEHEFTEAINYQHRFFPDESAAAPYLGMAKIYVNLDKPEKVLDCARKALAEPGVIVQHKLTAWTYICIAYYDGQYSRDDFNRAYAEREKLKRDIGHDDNFGSVVNYYHAMKNGRYAEALNIATDIQGGSDRLQFISNAYACLGDYRQAYLYQVHHKKYLDSINTAEVQKMSYEYAAQIDVTRAENEAKDLRLSNLDLQIQAAVIIILITIAFFIFYFFRRRKQMRELRHAYNQLADTTIAKERIDSELSIAREIQMSMVPRTFPAFPDRRDIDLYATIVPAKQVGGDLYDFFLQDDRLCFCVGDVSGKGIPASLTMAVAVNLFRTVAKEGFPPEVIAAKLNETMSANNENAVFVTMFIGIIDLKTGNLDYCNCGHNPPVYGERRMHTTQTVFRLLDIESNVPIGLWPDYTFVGGHLSDIRSSLLFVYTDGVNEAENRMQEQFGEKRMLRVLRESTQPFGERTPKTRSHFLIDEMKYALDAFVDGAEQSDDLTMLCVSIK
ncbi:MAG: SpoIIE family protein phosphatase [Prevotella sp.]|nr:SpoIIE family protein phosphatase [Prevotella sp.]